MTATFPFCITLSCDLQCHWCPDCHGPQEADYSPGEAEDAIDSHSVGASLVSLYGGNPLYHGALSDWITWARTKEPAPVVQVDTPGHHLPEAEVLDRLTQMKPDILRVMVPGTDIDTVAQWTGWPDYVERTFEGIEKAQAAGLQVRALIPINELTVETLEQTLLDTAERFGADLPIVLRRAPLVRPPEGPGSDVGPTWHEVEPLGRVLASLPDALPRGASYFIDASHGYGACLLPREAWRHEFLPCASIRLPGERPADKYPVPDLCSECAWAPRCEWWLEADEDAPRELMRPLSPADAKSLKALHPQQLPEGMGSEKHHFALVAAGLDGAAPVGAMLERLDEEGITIATMKQVRFSPAIARGYRAGLAKAPESEEWWRERVQIAALSSTPQLLLVLEDADPSNGQHAGNDGEHVDLPVQVRGIPESAHQIAYFFNCFEVNRNAPLSQEALQMLQACYAATYLSPTQEPTMLERTLAIIKPDATERNLSGQIVRRIEDEGFTIAAMKRVMLNQRHIQGFYAEHSEKAFFASLLTFMTSGPMVLLVLERQDAITHWRQIIGSTDPQEAADGTIRSEFAENKERNAVHGSDGPESALREISYFFNCFELGA